MKKMQVAFKMIGFSMLAMGMFLLIAGTFVLMNGPFGLSGQSYCTFGDDVAPASHVPDALAPVAGLLVAAGGVVIMQLAGRSKQEHYSIYKNSSQP